MNSGEENDHTFKHGAFMKNFLQSYCRNFLSCKRQGLNSVGQFILASIVLLSAFIRGIYDTVCIMEHKLDPHTHHLLLPSLFFGGFAFLVLASLPRENTP
jgi:hypothetical protein